MTIVAEKLKEEVLRLPASERAELAYCLIHSLDDEDESVQDAWADELEQRWLNVECGKVGGEPAESVFAEMRRKYPY